MKFIAIENIEEVVTDHPKFMKNFANWFTEKLIDGVDNPPKDLITDAFVRISLKVQPRLLYDFFDEKGILISVGKAAGIYDVGLYKGEAPAIGVGNFSNLHEAELAGFLAAIKMYENE